MWIRTAVLSLFLAGLVSAQQSKEDRKKADDEAKARLADFRKDLRKCKVNDDVGRAIAILGQFQHPRILAELKKWINSRQTDIAGVAAEMIAKYKGDRAAAELLAATALSRKEPEVVEKCLRYLADVKYRPIVPKILKFFRNNNTAFAREAIDTCAALKSKLAMDTLIKLARELDGIQDNANTGGLGGVADERLQRKRALSGPVEDALEAITGEKKKESVREWDRWWRRNKRSFKELELNLEEK